MIKNISIKMNLIAPFGADCLLIIFLYMLQSVLFLQEFFTSTTTFLVSFVLLFVILVLVSLLLPEDTGNLDMDSK